MRNNKLIIKMKENKVEILAVIMIGIVVIIVIMKEIKAFVIAARIIETLIYVVAGIYMMYEIVTHLFC